MSSLISNAKAQLKAKKGDDGFTLIELLIVIVVLGILAAIVVFGLAQFQNQSNTAACNADRKQVSTAADAWRADPANPDTGAPADVAALVTAGYLKAAPTTVGCDTAAALPLGFVGP